ncbi:helix-turn-helix domain-containing protein [Lederbergia galactosidilytica]|uniref:helix-turn-helix domain-containing protein n=1 Tax=Lederbergia galactosidilytica TaxID=217031 RepID=UPI0007170EBB|nr:helix-turn-helix transcriptional regulator [Lederbergia galactosidilytica]MBP1915314.1 transcriptional regulator with XRE-family HTH domain [Lederbergia galactosidilytica]
MTFGEKIQKLRKEQGISQEELSFQLQVSRQAISKWENDKGYPETEKIIKMSKIFQVSLDDLLNDSEDIAEKHTKNDKGFYVSQEMANGYLLHESVKYKKIALAIALLLAGTAFVFILSELGILIYLIMMIASIALFVSILLTGNSYPQIKKEALLFEEDFKKELSHIYLKKRKKYHLLILVSIIVFCFGFFLLPVAGLEFIGESGEDFVLAASMIIGGAAVYFFTYLLGVLKAYQLLIRKAQMLSY